MSFPDFDDLSAFSPAQQRVLRQFIAYLDEGYLAAQHKQDGSHAAITADSIALAEPAAPITSGNWTGDLVPTTNATYSLGAALGTATGASFELAWKWLYLAQKMFLGAVSSGGVNPILQPLVIDDVSGNNRTSTFNGSTAGSTGAWSIVNRTGATICTFGGAVVIGGSIRNDAAVNMSGANVRIGDFSCDNGLFEHARTTRMGEWQAPVFNAGNFTASGAMTWTVTSPETESYQSTLIGKTMIFVFRLRGTTVAGTPSTELRITLPGSVTIASKANGSFFYTDNGTNENGLWEALTGNTYVGLNTKSFGNWQASVTNTSVYGVILVEIQ